MDCKFLLSLPRKCIGKSSSRPIVFDKSPKSFQWSTPDPRVSPMNLMSYNLVLDNLYLLKSKFPNVMCTPEFLLVPTDDPELVYKEFQTYLQIEIPLEGQYIRQYTGDIRPRLKEEVTDLLSDLVEYCQVAITVTSNFVLNVYGTKNNVTYAQHKLFILLNHIYGYSVTHIELDLSMHQLVAGPDRQNLLTLFQQTGVNVYMPPAIDVPVGVDVNKIYLAGDKAQLLLAEKLLRDVVIQKTDCLEKECVISSFIRDVLQVYFALEIEQVMARFGTFVQLPVSGNVVRVMGTTRRSIDSSIKELMKFCGSIYCAEIQAHLDSSLEAQIGSSGVNLCSTSTGTVLYGTLDQIKHTLKIINQNSTDEVHISVLIEQPLELMDFILGKKQGKIQKVVNGTNTEITSEKWHDYNFRLRIRGHAVSNVIEALELLEQELPAERSLYIPEVYHKQVIGQGGLAIQQLMRKFNVYMRFANTTKEKYPNAFGDSRSENVIIRCPAKNRAQIDNAAKELLQHIEDLAKEHHCTFIKLSRNHRRLLLASESNALREIEVVSGAAIKLPADESREMQLIEISGQTLASTDMAVKLLSQLLSQTDYEFRIPWSPQFSQSVGPQSGFYEQVSVPLFLSMNAQVQCFEKVQMVGDSAIYSQVVVSLHEDIYGDSFEDISSVVTSFLRKQNLDIVDKGVLNVQLAVEPEILGSATNKPSAAKFDQNLGKANVVGEFQGHHRSLFYSPGRNQMTNFSGSLKEQPQRTRFSPVLSSPPTLSSFLHRPVDAPSGTTLTEPSFGLPSRLPMTSVQWNRNYDETPVKKRNDSERSQSSMGKQTTPMTRLNRLQRRV